MSRLFLREPESSLLQAEQRGCAVEAAIDNAWCGCVLIKLHLQNERPSLLFPELLDWDINDSRVTKSHAWKGGVFEICISCLKGTFKSYCLTSAFLFEAHLVLTSFLLTPPHTCDSQGCRSVLFSSENSHCCFSFSHLIVGHHLGQFSANWIHLSCVSLLCD